MPLRNLARTFIADSYYHIYNRGVNKRIIFLEDPDYQFFLSLFARHLSAKPVTDRAGREYRRLNNDVELLAYCLMPNHFHLMAYQNNEKGVLDLMLSVGTAYSMYFNRKYKRRGPLFESNYKASLISSDDYLSHISRYIHLNPEHYKNWLYSSYRAYVGKSKPPDWLRPQKVLVLFDSRAEYENFVNDYEEVKHSLDLIKAELANY